MTIAITDRKRLAHHGGHALQAVRAKIVGLDSPATHVLSDISVGSRECLIDHLVISPAGVFTVNAWQQPARKVWVSDYLMTVGVTRVPYLRNAKFEAERVERLLGAHVDFEVPVRGCVVVLTGAHAPQVTYASRPIGLSVLTKADVPRYFRRQPAVLTAEQVRDLFEIARRSATWA